MAEEYKFHLERTGFKFTVWANRIEVQQRGAFAWKSDTLLIKSITAVEVKLGGKLRITLSGGKPQEFILGTKAEEAKGAILALI